MDTATKQYSISELARQALEHANGDVAEAARYLEQQAKRQTSVWLTITESLISSACYDAVRAVCRKERRAIWTAPNYDQGGNGGRVVAHAKSLMDLCLPGGKRLADATKDDLLKARDFYYKQADTMRQFGCFLEVLSEKVKRSTVSDKLTEDELQKIKEQCCE